MNTSVQKISIIMPKRSYSLLKVVALTLFMVASIGFFLMALDIFNGNYQSDAFLAVNNKINEVLFKWAGQFISN